MDGNWLLHLVYRTKGMNSSVPERATALQILNYCCVFALQKEARYGALAFDGDNNFRYKIYPKYKGNRNGKSVTDSGLPFEREEGGMKDLMYQCLEPTQELFRLVKFPEFQFPDYEADDLVASGSRAFAQAKTGNFAWICGRDKDSFQAIRPQVNVYWPAVGKNPPMDLDEEAIFRRTGFYPKAYGDYQILIGDGIDGVPPVCPPAEAKRILRTHSSLHAYLKTKEGTRFYNRNQEALTRNLRLVRMDYRCWDPEPHHLRLDQLEDNRKAISEFGTLPRSFYALRSTLRATSRSLFG